MGQVTHKFKSHPIRQKSVVVEMVKGKAPKPEDVFILAAMEAEKPAYICAGYYAESVNNLRNKGFTWNEIHQWFLDQGLDFSLPAIQSGWRKSLRYKED